MSTGAWIMLVIHACLFVCLRVKISKKKRILEKENAIISVENTKLKSENQQLCKMLDVKYSDSHVSH